MDAVAQHNRCLLAIRTGYQTMMTRIERMRKQNEDVVALVEKLRERSDEHDVRLAELDKKADVQGSQIDALLEEPELDPQQINAQTIRMNAKSYMTFSRYQLM